MMGSGDSGRRKGIQEKRKTTMEEMAGKSCPGRIT
jgi:hypothetical protein